MLELRVTGAPAAIIPALLGPSGDLLLPVLPVVRPTELPLSGPGAEGVIVVTRLAGDATLLPAERLLVLGSDTVALAPDESTVHEGEVFLRADRLAAMLGGSIQADLASLVLTVSRDPPFPVEQRTQIARRRSALQRPGAVAPHAGVPYLARSGFGSVYWTYSSSDLGAPQAGHAGLRGSGSLLGGELSAGFTARYDQPAGRMAVAGSSALFTRVFPTGRLLRQLQLGDVVAGPVQARAFRGFLVSNAPYRPRTLFGGVTVDPDLPPGWTYEVYEDGRLVGFPEAGESGPVTVPLPYGGSRVQVRMYGPAGEDRVSEYRYLIPPAQLARGRAEYALGAGACSADRCDDYAFVDARVGLTSWLTFGSGVASSSSAGARDLEPHLNASVALPGGVTGRLSHLAGRLTHTDWAYYGTGPLWVSGQASLSGSGSGTLSFLPQGRGRWSAGLAAGPNRPTLPRPLRSLRIGTRLEGERGGGADRIQVTTGFAALRSLFDLTYEANPAQPEALLSLQASTTVPASARVLARRPVSGRITWTADRLQQMEVSTYLPLRAGNLGLAMGWARGAPHPSLSAGYSVELGTARVQARATRLTTGSVVTGGYAEGTVALGPAGPFASAQGAVSVGGVAGVVFVDENGNGRHDPPEPSVADALVTVGALQARTDGNGRYRIWGIPAYDVVAVGLDTLSLPDPGLLALRRQGLIRPNPAIFDRVDFPVVTTRELTGRLVAVAPVPTAGGVTVLITHVQSGDTIATRSFSDGEFYLSRLRPGEYRARVAESSLQALRARSSPDSLAFTVPADPMVVSVELPWMHLVGAAQAEPSEPELPPLEVPGEPSSPAEPELPLLGRAYFDFDRSELRPEALAVLDEVVGHMRANPRLRVEVQGHTDSRGAAAYNLRLSAERARAVAEYLIQRGGDRARITTRGYGEERPLAPNDTEAGRDRNRRVEFRQSLDPADPPAPAEVPR